MNAKFSDTDLWNGLLAGDEAALDSIYKAHFQSLYQYGMRLLGNEDMVRDCLHNLFLKIWDNRKGLNKTDHIRYYLLSAFRNVIINYHRKENRHEKVVADDRNFFDMDFTLESAYIQKEDLNSKTEQLARAMDQLTTRQKEIIYLKYFEELDYAKIAEIMDLTTKGAYKLSARALEALRDIMGIDRALILILLLELKKFQFFLK